MRRLPSGGQPGLSAEASHGGHADQGDPIRRRENTKEALEEEFSKYGEMWMQQQEYWREKFWEDFFWGRIGETPEEWKSEAEKRNLCDELKDNVIPILYRYHYDQAIGETEPEGLRRRGSEIGWSRKEEKQRRFCLRPKPAFF